MEVYGNNCYKFIQVLLDHPVFLECSIWWGVMLVTVLWYFIALYKSLLLGVRLTAQNLLLSFYFFFQHLLLPSEPSLTILWSSYKLESHHVLNVNWPKVTKLTKGEGFDSPPPSLHPIAFCEHRANINVKLSWPHGTVQTVNSWDGIDVTSYTDITCLTNANSVL